jgi:SAM-dependent methyltransferase
MAFIDGYDKAAHLYDLFDTKANIGFYLHFSAGTPEVLDIGAGTGRIAIPIAEAGTNVMCIEPSSSMRRILNAKIENRRDLRSRITLVPDHAVGFDIGRTFPGAFMSASFDHLLDDHARRAALSNISKHLASGARFVFDTFVGHMEASPCKLAGEATRGDLVHKRLIEREVLPDSKIRMTLFYETWRAGELVERIEQVSYAGITNRLSIHRLLSEAGLRVEREFGDYDFSPFEEGADMLLVEAVKQ